MLNMWLTSDPIMLSDINITEKLVIYSYYICIAFITLFDLCQVKLRVIVSTISNAFTITYVISYLYLHFIKRLQFINKILYFYCINTNYINKNYYRITLVNPRWRFWLTFFELLNY